MENRMAADRLKEFKVKIAFTITCAMIGFWITGAHAQGLRTRVTEVNLYPDSAEVVRTISVARGSRSVDIDCLPATFDPQSLRVESGGAVRVGDVRVETLPRSGTACSTSELEARIHALEEQRAILDVQAKANGLSANYLRIFSEHIANADSRTSSADSSSLTRSVEALGNAARVVYAKEDQIKQRDIDLKSQLDALQQSRSGGVGDSIRRVRIAVDAPSAGDLRVAYLTTRAGWRPTYQASVDTNRSTVVLERQATIAQTTGEDWRGVRLRLSTGEPHSTLEGREPTAWQLDIVAPVQQTGYSPSMPMLAPAVAAPIAEAMERVPRASEPPVAPLFDVNTVQTDFATEFEVPGAVDLPSDAQKATYSLAKETFPAKLTVRSTPRLDSAAYLVATLDRPSGIWPAGTLQLRREGSVVGTTQWNPASADEQLTLPFGRDALVSVAVELPKASQRNVGVLDSRRERETTSVYTVRNGHRAPFNIEILEATPISQSEDIRVRATFSPQPTERDWQHRPGVIAWQQTLRAGESLHVVANYIVTYPKDARVSGLP